MASDLRARLTALRRALAALEVEMRDEENEHVTFRYGPYWADKLAAILAKYPETPNGTP